jgi:capsular polysaccharide biosynthesis protein
MAEQAVWHLKRVKLAVPVPSVAAIRARAWMLGPPLLLGLLAALLAIQVPQRTFRAQAQVLFSISDPVPRAQDPRLLAIEGSSGFMTTQATLARSPELARRVIAAAGVPAITPAQFLRHSGARPQSDSSVLNLSVSHRKADAAIRLANAYADQFTRYKTERDLAGIKKVLSQLDATINSLRARGLTGSPAYEALVKHRVELQTAGALLAGRARVLQAAERASSFRPHALRNGIIGGLLGALLGIALVAVVRIWPKNSRPQAI